MHKISIFTEIFLLQTVVYLKHLNISNVFTIEHEQNLLLQSVIFNAAVLEITKCVFGWGERKIDCVENCI